jgi:hypothetical protein
MNDTVKQPVTFKSINNKTFRARYEAIGVERALFGTAAIATVVGTLLPIVRAPSILLSVIQPALHFYNLGVPGWLAFLAMTGLAGAPFARPTATIGVAAVPLLVLAGALVGAIITLFAVSTYGFFSVDLGADAWAVAAFALTAAYSRRIFSLHQ